MSNTAQDTNSIQDNVTRRAVRRAIRQLNGSSVTATEMDQRCFSVKLEDVSVAQSVYAPIPWTGDITTIYAVQGATSTAIGSTYSFGVSLVGAANIDLSGNTIAIPSGNTAATGVSVDVTASARSVTAGSIMRFASNGASSGPTMDCVFTVLMDIT